MFFMLSITPAHALKYSLCKSPKQSLPCAVAFEKLRVIDNPITKKKFFDDGVHIKNNKLLIMPTIHVATPDLDNDGYPEIIIALSEDNPKSKDLFCQSDFKCPHFVIQDRNPDPKKPRLRHYSAIASIYAYGVAPSTNEKINGYQSLVAYKTNRTSNYNIYQYDKKTDKYYDLGLREGKK
jgi:hypothetical protein